MIWLFTAFSSLRGGDGHVFQLSEDVHKLHADKPYILLFHHADDVFLV